MCYSSDNTIRIHSLMFYSIHCVFNNNDELNNIIIFYRIFKMFHCIDV